MRNSPRSFKFIRIGGRLAGCAIVAASVLGVFALPASGAPPSIRDQEQQARAIMGQLNALDSELNRAVEAYNGAQLQLSSTELRISDNRRELRIVRRNLTVARLNLDRRLVSLYTSDEQQSSVEIIFGARSLDDLIGRLDFADRVATQDSRIARQTSTFHTQVRTREVRLERDRARVQRLVAAAEAGRRQVQAKIAERRQLLSSVKGEIARMKAAEQARQLRVAAEVRARLAAQQAAARTQQAAPAAAETTAAPADPLTVSTDPAAPPPAAVPPSRYGGVVGIAMRYLGVPYKWGGASPSGGFDCSGFTMYVYAQIGVSLPHYTGSQWQMGSPVSRDQLQPGDLVFFDGLGHEGMYIGNNQFIHAPHTGDVVKISSISGWYSDTYEGARRL